MYKQEKLYRLKCGNQYVKFNLDGTVRGSKASNAVITESYIKKYPFNIQKAIASGIISIEEVSH